MTLPRAMEILELSKNCEFEGDAEELEQAEQLGIEAIKAVQRGRARGGWIGNVYLPGETEEVT